MLKKHYFIHIVLLSFLFSISYTDIIYSSQNETITIPENLAVIEGNLLIDREKQVVIHIQDAHCFYPVQKQIIKIIEYLASSYQISQIFVEGADQYLNADSIKSFPDDQIKKNVSEYFLKEGKISGVEYFIINNLSGIKAKGAESKKVYRENYLAFSESQAVSDEILLISDRLSDILKILQQEFYSTELLEIDSMEKSYLEGEETLRRYLNFIISKCDIHSIEFNNQKNIVILEEIIVLEKQLNYFLIEKEKNKLISVLQQKLTTEQKAELLDATLSYSVNKISPANLFNLLIKFCETNNIQLAQFPEINKYMTYLNKSKLLNMAKLDREINGLTNNIRDKILQNDQQRTLVKLDNFLKTLKKVTQLKASSAEIKFYSDNKQWFLTSLNSILTKSSSFSYPSSVIEQSKTLISKMRRFENFYDCVLKRDSILVQNTVDQMKLNDINMSVLITGGFHSEGIRDELSEQGISVISLTPNLLGASSGYKSNYTNAILGTRNALENYLFLNWNSLAVASILVEGSPLAQEWKGQVYKRELEITQLALKLCAIRTSIESTLGIEAGEYISDKIAADIASSLKNEADEFLSVWNDNYKNMTGQDHPLLENLKVSTSTIDNNIFLELTLNGKKIFFPLETGLALDPGTLINSFLTPDNYTSILEGNPYARESVISFAQIKDMRTKIKDILVNSNSSVDFISEEDKNIISDIIKTIIHSNPDIFANRNLNLNTSSNLEEISKAITKAISDIYVERVSQIASKSLNYEDLLDLTKYGSSATLHFMLKTMKAEEPVLAYFFEYLIDRYSLFNPEQEVKDIRIITENLFDEFLLTQPEAAQLNIDSNFLNKISDMVYAGLKIGDAIRPHAIACSVTYGLNLSDSMTFNEILAIHDIFEEESIYGVNEVIKLLLSSNYINSSMAKALISKPLPFPDLMDILQSQELKALKQSPTPQNFSFFVTKFNNKLEEPILLQLYISCLNYENPLRTALTSLLVQGWDINNQRSNRFNLIAAQQKVTNLTEDADKLNYDMAIIALLGYLPDELFMPDEQIAGVGIHNLDQLDKSSPFFDKKILDRFFSQAVLAGNKITMLSLDPGFTDNLDEITTQSGLTLNRNEYMETVYSYLQSVKTPVMLYVDKEKVAAIEDHINSLNLSSMVVLIAYDYKQQDISLAGEKRLSFLGYWMNLTEILVRNFKGTIELINSNRNVQSRFEDFHRDYIDFETLIPNHAKMDDDTVKILAQKGNSQTLDELMMSGQITPDVYPDLIGNENFDIDSVITLIRDSELPLTNELFDLIHTKIPLHELKKLFPNTQNIRAAYFFNYLVQKDPKIASFLYGELSVQELINLFVLSQKLGFTFTEETIPSSRNEGFVMDLTYKTALYSPSLASSMLTVFLNTSPDTTTTMMQKLAKSDLEKSVIQTMFTQTLKNYASQHPDFIELMPLFESDITPLWHKAFVLDYAIRLKDNPENLQRYIYGILNIFNEQSEFFEWLTINKEKHSDRVNEWLQVVSLYPEIQELRSPELLQSAIMIDVHILNQYREFLVKLASKKEPYKALQEDINIFQLIFQSVNSVFSSPIESKMFIFHLLPFVLDYLPENMGIEELFENYLEKIDRKGKIIQPGIPIYAILPAIIFAEGNTDILDNFKKLFSIDYISRSTLEKTHLVSSFLRIFASIDHAYLYEAVGPEIIPSKTRKKDFLKILSFNTSENERNDLMELFQTGERTQKFINNQFAVAQRKYRILLNLTQITSSKTAKKDQRIINDILDFLFILSENYEMLEQAPGKPHEKFDNIIDNFESYSNLRELKNDLMKVFAEFIKIDFPDVFESDEDVIAKLPKIENIASFWVYKNDWKEENQRGIALLRQAIHDYLLDGSSLKSIKYGGTPESAKQMEILEALIYQRVLSRLQGHLQEDEAKKEASNLTAHYMNTWKTDMNETIDLSALPPAKSNETYVAWTSDEVPDWMNFGMSGGATCLAPGNISVYTKNLPGYIFSGLVSGGLYFGKYKGDIRDRVNQALLPVVIKDEPNLFVVNQYYYSSGGETGNHIGYASILASIRNAARYGADGIIIPTGSPQSGYLSSLENFLNSNFSTVFEHRSPSGKLIKRERITIKEIDTRRVDLIVPKEANQWRYFDAAKMAKGHYYEKLSDNFSFVNFDDSITQEVAGVQFEGLQVETPSLVIMIERDELPIDETYTPVQKTSVSLSDTIKTFIQEGRLISLLQLQPDLQDKFKKLSFSERTTGKFLNNLLYLSEQLSTIVEEQFVTDNPENRFFVLSATQRALPIVRKLNTMLEGHDYVTGEINTETIIDNEKTSRTVFIVDEGILTGSTASNQIQTVLENNDVLPEEIIFISLTADPKAVERILRKFPDIKMIVGMFEERTEQDGTVVSSVIGDQITNDMLFDLSSNPKVTLNNIEYKIVADAQSSQAYNAFIAESETGEKVFLKTTVSATEGKQFQQIWRLVQQYKLDLGVPEVYQYDETTGILATSYIDGPAFDEYIKTSDKSPEELMINILDALRDASEVAMFLSRSGALHVNITPGNIRLNLKNNKWYITNYSPFPYRVQPLEESGVLRQLEWILSDVLTNFKVYTDEELNDNDKHAISQLETLLQQIKTGEIDKLYDFISSAQKATQSFLTPDNIFRTYTFPPETTNALQTILNESKLDQKNLEDIYTTLRLKLFSGNTLTGILQMYSDSHSGSLINEDDLSKQVTHTSKTIESFVPNAVNAEYIYLEDDENFFSALYSDNPLSDSEISALAEQTDNLKNNLRQQADLILEYVQAGKPVILAGNIETIKWIYSEIFNTVGEKANSLIYILPQLSQFHQQGHYNQVLLSRYVALASQLFFSRSFQRENQNFNVTETSILNWNDTTELKGQNLSVADHIRRRIINNPRFNIFIRTPDKKLAGVMSAAVSNYPTSILTSAIPNTDIYGNALFYYSLFMEPHLEQDGSFRQILLDIQHHISLMHQYSKSYRYHSSFNVLEYLINSRYLPVLMKKRDVNHIVESIIEKNNPDPIINLFTAAENSIQKIIQESIKQTWQTDSSDLKNILTGSGQSAFLSQTILRVTNNILDYYKNQFPDTPPDEIISSLLGVSFLPVDYLSTSSPKDFDSDQEIQTAFKTYSEDLEDVYPLTAPLNNTIFERILKMDTGTEALKLWLKHHDKELLTEWENYLGQPAHKIPATFVEKFGSALLSFLRFTGRSLPDKNISDTLISTNSIISQVFSSLWNDPLHPGLANMSLGYGFYLRMPYLIGSEEEYLQNWFDRETAIKLNELINSFTGQRREQIIITIINMDFDKNYKNISKLIKAIFKSPLSSNSRAEILEHNLEKTAAALQEFDDSTNFLIFDTNSDISPAQVIQSLNANPNTVLFLTGDYKNVRQFYNNINLYLSEDIKTISNINNRIIGLTPAIKEQPEFIKQYRPFLRFNIIDDSITTSRLTAVPNIPLTDYIDYFSISKKTLCEVIGSMMGQGGLLSVICEKLQKDPNELTNFDIVFESELENNIFLKITLVFGENQFEILAKASTIKVQPQTSQQETAQPMELLDNISDNILSPLPALTKRQLKITNENIMEFSVFETFPAGTSVLPVLKPGFTPESIGSEQRKKEIIRKQAEQLTRLWQLYGLIPNLNQSNFLIEEVHGSINLYLLADTANMTRSDNETELFFNLFNTFGTDHIEEILKGIFDGFEGNINLFSSFIEKIKSADFTNLIADEVVNECNRLLPPTTPKSLISHIQLRISNLIKSSSPGAKLDFTGIIPFLKNAGPLADSFQDLNDYANELTKKLTETQNTITNFTETKTQNMLTGLMENHLNQLENIFVSDNKSTIADHMETIESYLKIIQEQNLLSPTQLINARILSYKLLFSEQFTSQDGQKVANQMHNPALTNALDKIYDLTQNYPNSIIDIAPAIADEADISLNEFWNMILPGFNDEAQTFSIENTQLHLSKLPLLLRAEKTLKSNPILLTADSMSPENFTLFKQLASMFKINVLKTDPLSSLKQTIKNPDMENKKSYEQNKTLLRLKHLLQHQVYPIGVDMREQSAQEIITYFHEDQFFDFTSVNSIESFLEHVTARFENTELAQVSFSLDESLLPDDLKDQQNTIDRLMRTVIELRLMLAQAAQGNVEAKENFMKYAQLLGIENSAEEFLINEQIKVPQITMTALILDKIKKSGRLPEISELLTAVSESGKVNETKFMLLVNVYTNLTLQFFAEKISKLAEEGDITIDVDSETIRLAGKSLIASGDDYKYIFSLLKEAKISIKTFEKNISAQTVIQYAQSVIPSDILFIRSSSVFLSPSPDEATKKQLNNRSYELIESAL